jgi:hypothetical protein
MSLSIPRTVSEAISFNRNQMMFFCGNTPDCIAFNSASALNVAKAVVDKHFAVVGVLEHLVTLHLPHRCLRDDLEKNNT